MRRLLLLGLMALAGCHDHRSDDANATLAVDNDVIAASSNAIGPGPYLVFCKSKDPRGEPYIGMITDWPSKENWPNAGKGYKKCEVSWAK